MTGAINGTSDADYPSRGYAWTVVAILVATAILSYTDRQVLSLLVDPIRADPRFGELVRRMNFPSFA